MMTTTRGTGHRLSRKAPQEGPRPPWRLMGAGAGVLGIEGATLYLHPALGECLIAADAIVPAVVALVLLAVILRGSNETCERVFRLLRWVANRPEPPGPAA